MVKKYHPDMRMDEKAEYEPSIDKFRDVAEAY
jgi:DnaJ-class molecular chaperone